jgi:hypothetical protein
MINIPYKLYLSICLDSPIINNEGTLLNLVQINHKDILNIFIRSVQYADLIMAAMESN